jgi:hypothetical protein
LLAIKSAANGIFVQRCGDTTQPVTCLRGVLTK